MPPRRLNTLADLGTVKAEMAQRQQAAAKAAQAARERARKAVSDAELFRRAAGAVKRLDTPPPADRRAGPKPTPEARQTRADEQRVQAESLSDAFDVTTLLDVDGELSYLRPGLGKDVLRRLRKGDWSIQKEVDLHGLRRDDAREALSGFIQAAHKAGLRCVRVVHGKGLGSPGKEPVLRSRVRAWLVQKREVIAFVQARPADGGAGALVVLLDRPATMGR